MSTDDEVLREADSLVRELSNDLVTLERSPDDEAVAGLFRAAHTLKSNCAMAGIDGAATLAHAVEDFLAAVRSGDVVPDGTLVDGALDAVDGIEAILNAAGGDATPTPAVDPDATAAVLRDLIEKQGETKKEIASTDMDATEMPDIDIELPEPDADLSAEEALERVSVFDDLDRLVATIDDDEAFAGLEGAGTFDTIEGSETSSQSSDGESSLRSDRRDPKPDTVETLTPEADEDAPSDDSVSDDTEVTDDPFIWVKEETTEETDVDALEADLEDVSFGEFDDEDEMSIQELIEMEPTAESDTDTTETSEVDDTVETPTPEADEGSVSDTLSDDTEVTDDPFVWVKEETTEETDVDALEADLEDVSFGEFDDEDEMSIQELIEIEPADTDEDIDQTQAESSTQSGQQPEPDGSGDITERSSTSNRPQAGDREAQRSSSSRPERSEGCENQRFSRSRKRNAFSRTPQAARNEVPQAAGRSPATQADAIEFEREAGTKAFAERFGGLFDVDSDGEGAIRSVGTIEDSELDADRFSEEPSVDIDLSDTSIHSISVDVGTADDLLNLVEELSMSRLSFEDALGEGVAEEAENALGTLQSIESEFRRSVMELRLMPLSSAVDGLARVTRDIARDQGKRISFDIEGEDVRLDRSVAERIGEPLIHLVRNAADHGIEPPEEREEAGKPAEGRIELRAERVRNGAVIEVEDDGRGIDPDAILTTGIEEGVVTRAEAETMDDEDAYELLFHHGLTTSEEITNVSGRGVGMDIVARVCSDLDGSVEVESEPGEGTTVRLRLPVTVAMAKLLFVEASGERYAIPTSDIEYIGTSRQEDERDDRTLVPEPSPDWDESDGDDRYRLVRLHEAFDVPAPSADEGTVVWLRDEIGRIAIHCDDVVESREAVVKPYGPPLDHVPGISGATMGENGDVINIIDVTTIA